MILKAQHNFIIYPFFKKYSQWIIKKHFSNVVINGNFLCKQKSVLLLCNHISWWDGFWIMYLNIKVFKMKFHFMMLEEQLRKYFLFNYSGGFSIKKKSKSLIESLNYTLELLLTPENFVLIFPQGEIESMHNNKISFQKGINKIISKINYEKVQIVFVVNLIDYFSKPKPTLYSYIKEINYNEFNLSEIENNYNIFYQNCLNNQLKEKF